MATKTLIDTDSTQTMSGKTLTAPVVNGGTCGADPTTPLGIATKAFVESFLSVVFPTGVQVPYGGASAPSGFLLCDGSAVSRTTYAGLFAVIGTTYGAGDGSTTFTLPDKRGRGSIGAGAGAGLSSRTRGTKGGAETHTLVEGEIPNKTLSVTLPINNGLSSSVSGNSYVKTGNQDGTDTINTTSFGGGGSHNNMQPYEVDTWIIKT